MATVAVGAALLCGFLAASGCRGKAAQPDVLVVVMGTTRADRCSFEGYGRPTTPRLEEFAKEAAVFTDAWTPGGWTGPALASLFTGLRPENHGFDSIAATHLGEEHATLAERLGAAGYATGCISNDDVVGPELGLIRGFEHFEPLYLDTGRPYPWATAAHERAAAWAESVHAAGKPFFLVVVDGEPDMPYAPPPEVATAFVRGNPTAAELREARAFTTPRDLLHDLGVRPFTERELALMSDLYDAEVATLDREIGTFFDRLRKDGLLGSTVVVVVGDHGENFNEHGLVAHAFSMHRSICRVPLLVRIPVRFDGPMRVDSVARLEDVFPTVVEACGLPASEGIDGETLTRNLAGRVARGSVGVYENVRKALDRLAPGSAVASRLLLPIRSVYDGTFHYLARGSVREELYDVRRDPDERVDLAPARGEVLARMRR